MTKFKADANFGMHPFPRHGHGGDHGLIIHGDEAGTETKLDPSLYLFVLSELKHTTACSAGVACVFYEELSGESDMKPVEAPAAP